MAKGVNTAPPFFLSFWLAFWSLGVGVISSIAVSSGGMIWLFVFTHGGAEIGVAWLLASTFAAAMERTLRPPELELDLGGVRGRWGSGPRSVFTLTSFLVVGAIIAVLLIGGTWGPVATAGEISTKAVLIATALTAAWGIIAWRWILALRRMLAVLGSVELSATLDRVSVVHRRGAVEVTHEYPAAGLRAEEEGNFLVLTRGEERAEVPCRDSAERTRLVTLLNEMSAKADAPGERSEIPAELAAMRGATAPAGQ